MNISIILSGGTGKRFESINPKQYQMLMGKEVISYSINAMNNSTLTNLVLVVTGKNDIERITKEYNVLCIEGSLSRNGSLWNALDYINKKYPLCNHVFINEAARPFLTSEIVDKYYSYLCDYDAVITMQQITDSLGKKDEHVINRDDYYLIQAPEAFRFDLLYQYFSPDSLITATVQQLPPDIKIKRYSDFKNNIKITYKEDLMIASLLMQQRY